jgi:hypothetical protein
MHNPVLQIDIRLESQYNRSMVPVSWQEVIQVPTAGFESPADAAGMLDASLDHLATVDWASLGTRAHGEMLAYLQRAQAKLTAVNASVLGAFTVQCGYEPDGHKSARAWLVNKAGVSKGAAGAAVGWDRRLRGHRLIAAAMTGGAISESWAREIAQWTDKLPAQKRDEADAILLDAAAGGLPLEDLAALARTIDETWKARHPDPDDGNGDNGGSGDEDGFEDRYLRLGTTLDGVGALNGTLTAGCAAALQAIFDSLGKHQGPQDHRSIQQRQHDALAEALHRLIKADLLPQSAGQTTMAQVLIAFADLRRQPGASALEQQWITAQAGCLGGPSAQAEACDALIAPVVTGSVDWQALDAMTDVWLAAHGLSHRRQPCGCTCGGCTCTPPAPLTPGQKADLRRALLGLAADAMSGPDGLASYLRTRELGVPYSGKSLPLDVGRVSGIPDHLRRAVILRDRHCAWPGGCDKPAAGCQVHHVVFRSRGGKTKLSGLVLLCSYHHQVCIHRLGWTLILHADGTTEARSPDGQILRSHGPPTSRAG